jgi:hypothetical protein
VRLLSVYNFKESPRTPHRIRTYSLRRGQGYSLPQLSNVAGDACDTILGMISVNVFIGQPGPIQPPVRLFSLEYPRTQTLVLDPDSLGL